MYFKMILLTLPSCLPRVSSPLQRYASGLHGPRARAVLHVVLAPGLALEVVWSEYLAPNVTETMIVPHVTTLTSGDLLSKSAVLKENVQHVVSSPFLGESLVESKQVD